MNFFQRAVLYLTRKKGRTVLLTALLFLMSCCVCLGVSFKKNAEEQTDRLRKSLAAGFIYLSAFALVLLAGEAVPLFTPGLS